jgi:hypothetical protein
MSHTSGSCDAGTPVKDGWYVAGAWTTVVWFCTASVPIA